MRGKVAVAQRSAWIWPRRTETGWPNRRRKPGTQRVGRISAPGAALSDPIRVRMLGVMAAGCGCCELPDCGVPAEDQGAGICVCEFERAFDMGQSKVSYHLRKLKEAELGRETRRGS